MNHRGIYLFCLAIGLIHSTIVEVLYALKSDMWESGSPYIYYVRTISLLLSFTAILAMPATFWVDRPTYTAVLYYIFAFLLYGGSALVTLLYTQFNSFYTLVLTFDIVTCLLTVACLFVVIRYKLNEVDTLKSVEGSQLLLPAV